MDQNGRSIRYGLANDSKKVNKVLKSADLIGITPVLITQGMINTIMGVFTSIEVKRAGWTYTGTEKEQAQLAWMHLITLFGGRAGFATSREDLV